ncbi:Hypothetical protein, conserved [Brucella abortus str. 2308 A]|nr:hypothetical protein BMNI_II0609 [Brucella melitensis NI]EEP62075.1 Hypothetical protein, conserved [Brucella abortus str. 2308 A]
MPAYYSHVLPNYYRFAFGCFHFECYRFRFFLPMKESKVDPSQKNAFI